MKRTIAAVVFFPTLAATAAAGTYLGSIVNSWDAQYHVGPLYCAPTGLCYGDKYVWVSYDWFFAKRIPADGKVADVLSFFGPSGQDLGYENAPKYLYFATYVLYVYVHDSSTGETVCTFACPPGVPKAAGIDFDNSQPSKPVWLTDLNAPAIWNLTSTGSVITSFTVSFGPIGGLAYASDIPGGPYLFAGTRTAPSMVYALAPASGSILYSFKAPPAPTGLKGLGWDGRYLWTLDAATNSPTGGYAFQFIAYGDFNRVTPASLGRIKILFR